jgi:hypothetical protein
MTHPQLRVPLLDPVTRKPLAPHDLRTCRIRLAGEAAPLTVSGVAAVQVDKTGALTCTDGEGLAVAQVAAGYWIHWLIEPPETDRPLAPKHRGRPQG